MHLRHFLILALLALALAACGGQQGTNTVTSAAVRPADMLTQAIAAMANRDEADLSDMDDSLVAMYAAPFAHTAISNRNGQKDKVDPRSTISLGPVEIGTADRSFRLRQHDQAWKRLEAQSHTTERKYS